MVPAVKLDAVCVRAIGVAERRIQRVLDDTADVIPFHQLADAVEGNVSVRAGILDAVPAITL